MRESPRIHYLNLFSGLKLGRLKTGTTPRLYSSSLNYDVMTPQPGDRIFFFLFRTEDSGRHLNQMDCYLTNTNPITHQLVG